MEKIVFVTSNYGKGIRAQEQFSEQSVDLEWYVHDCNEPNINDIEYISKYKVFEAYSIVQRPCFVIDSGFYIDNYPGNPGFPGAFPKRAIINVEGKDGIPDLLETMKDVKDRRCRFVDCLTYYDGVEEPKVFYGIYEGNLAYEKKEIPNPKEKSKLWYIFVPLNHNKTLSEMTDEERNNLNDDRTSAVLEFIKWYKNECSQNKQLSLAKTNKNVKSNQV